MRTRATLGGVVPALLFACLAVWVTGCASESRNGARQGAMVGELARDFRLPGLDGGTVALADHAGEIVILNFWATWCPPCQQELPDLEATFSAYRDKGLVVLGIAVQEPADLVRPFVVGKGLTYRIALDEQGRVMNRFRVPGIPTTLVIDRQGVIRSRHVGTVTREMLVQDLKPLLGAPALAWRNRGAPSPAPAD